MREYEIRDGISAHIVGKLCVERCGLYYEFRAQTALSAGLRRLVVRDANGNLLRLGTPAPCGGKLRLSRRFSATELMWDGFSPENVLTAVLLPSDVPEKRDSEVVWGAYARLPLNSLEVKNTRAGLEVREELSPRMPLLLNPWFSHVGVERDGERIFCVLRVGKSPRPQN